MIKNNVCNETVSQATLGQSQCKDVVLLVKGSHYDYKTVERLNI